MRKIILSALLLSAIFMSCKKDTVTTTPSPSATFSYGAWSSCSPSGIQTRTWTVSPAGSTVQPPTDSVERTCQFSVIFYYGDWSACNNGIQYRSVDSTYPADSFNVSEPPVDSTERFCNGAQTFIIGSWNIVADSTYDYNLNTGSLSNGAGVLDDVLYNPLNTMDDIYQFTADSLIYDQQGTDNPVDTSDNFITLSPAQAWKYSGTTIKRYSPATSTWYTWYYTNQLFLGSNKMELYRGVEWVVQGSVIRIQFTTFQKQ